jgi:hypothetical protein
MVVVPPDELLPENMVVPPPGMFTAPLPEVTGAKLEHERTVIPKLPIPKQSRKRKEPAVPPSADASPDRLRRKVADFSPDRGSRVFHNSRFTRMASGVIAYPRTMNSAAPAMTAKGNPSQNKKACPGIRDPP